MKARPALRTATKPAEERQSGAADWAAASVKHAAKAAATVGHYPAAAWVASSPIENEVSDANVYLATETVEETASGKTHRISGIRLHATQTTRFMAILCRVDSRAAVAKTSRITGLFIGSSVLNGF